MRRVAVVMVVAALAGCGSVAATAPEQQAAVTTSTTPAPSSALEAPESLTPAAGFCSSDEGPVANVSVDGTNIPQPRCLVIRGEQHLSVTNNRSIALAATIGTRFKEAVPAGETVTFPLPVGTELAPGVHRLVLTPADSTNGTSADIWVDAVCAGPGPTNCSTPTTAAMPNSGTMTLETGPYGFLVPSGWQSQPLTNSGGPSSVAAFVSPDGNSRLDYEASGGEAGAAYNSDHSPNLDGALSLVRCSVTEHTSRGSDALSFSCSSAASGVTRGVLTIEPWPQGWKSLSVTLPPEQSDTTDRILASFS